jgi:peptidoglycan/xylan/chitin deacetylase (PgdA/CDA1 family)
MKLFTLIITILSQCVFSATNSQKAMYARLHAQNLIIEFDALLDQKLALNDKEPLIFSKLYQQLLATRMYIEGLEGHTDYSSSPDLLLTHDFKVLEKVKNEISIKEELIKSKVKSESQGDNLVIFPSTGSDGNLTGNTFPKNVWSLTFDDGPHRTRTNRVLDHLNETALKATFFVLVERSNSYPAIVNDIINDGMELALHSYTHANLSKSSSHLDYEITKAKSELENKTNTELKVFRLPYGAGMRKTRVREVIKKNNMVHIFWNIDTLDWQDKNPQSIFERTKKMMSLTPNNSGIILFHDIHNQSVIASRLVMDYLNAENKTVCTVSEVINFFNKKSQDCINE